MRRAKRISVPLSLKIKAVQLKREGRLTVRQIHDRLGISDRNLTAIYTWDRDPRILNKLTLPAKASTRIPPTRVKKATPHKKTKHRRDQLGETGVADFSRKAKRERDPLKEIKVDYGRVSGDGGDDDGLPDPPNPTIRRMTVFGRLLDIDERIQRLHLDLQMVIGDFKDYVAELVGKAEDIG